MPTFNFLLISFMVIVKTYGKLPVKYKDNSMSDTVVGLPVKRNFDKYTRSQEA